MKLIIFFLFFSFSAKAALTAKVLLVKGNVTKLEPGKMQAKKLKKGDRLVEDTSIHSGERSFALLKFSDGSRMNVGAKSKLVVSKMPAKKASMVKLINGIIKAEVKPETKKKTKVKLFVKTRTAVMGVRGTKFQTTFNGKADTTSLVTVEGKVAMKKSAPKEMQQKLTEPDLDELDKSFDNAQDVVEVPEGQYSGINPQVAKPVEPVKIAPQQYNAMAKSMGSKKRAKDVMKMEAGGLKSKAGLRSGGFVDFNTGLYIAPPADAKIDKKTGTYKAPKLGRINKRTGDFIPPKGVKVDPKKGLVVDKKALATIASAKKREQIENQLAKIKSEPSPLVVNKVEKKAKKKSNFWGWLPDDHVLSAKYLPYSEKSKGYTKDGFLNMPGSKATHTESADFLFFNWRQNWNKKWFTKLTLGEQTYRFDVENLAKYGDDEKGDYFSFGVGYHLNEKWTVSIDAVDRKLFFLVSDYWCPQSASFQCFRSSVKDLSYFDLKTRYQFARLDSMKFFADISVYLMGEEEVPEGSSQNYGEKAKYQGFSFSLEGEWMKSKSFGIYPSLRVEHMTVEGDTVRHLRNSQGLGLDFIWDI